MRVRLPMTIQALPGAIGPVPNAPFTPSDWSLQQWHPCEGGPFFTNEIGTANPN